MISVSILLFILVSFTAFVLLFAVLPQNKARLAGSFVLSLILGFLCKGIGTYTGCADGWKSTNIGEQGACSHHGGVVTHLNVYGITLISICTLLLVIFITKKLRDFKNG